MSGRNIIDSFFLERGENIKKLIESKIPQLRDSQLYSEFPYNNILDSDQAIKILKDKTGLNNDQEIADSLNRLFILINLFIRQEFIIIKYI